MTADEATPITVSRAEMLGKLVNNTFLHSQQALVENTNNSAINHEVINTKLSATAPEGGL